ncbi:MAG TPA: SPOR domain-containing protein [Stellaceae bacterium]|jgi:cell division septation protein DedD|nr:SPOR domain-containing protein [Stellaceae bacterium]
MSELGIDPDDRRPPSPPQSPSRKRLGRLALPLAAAAILLVAVGAARALHLGPSFMDNPPAQVPVIAPDAGPDKSVPDNPGGMAVPDQDKIILNGDSATPKVEQLLPPPETPLPPPVVAAPATPVAPPIAAPSGAAPVVLVPPAPTPPLAPPPPVVAAPTSVPVTPPPSAHAPAAPPAATANPHPPGKGYFLQLASVRSTEEAQANWSRLKAAQPDLLGKLPANAVRVDLGERGIYYRIMVGPIAEEGSATRLCNSLKQRHVACILVRP